MSSDAVKNWRARTKARIVESMGGKCTLCGYSRCNDALELHHLHPSKKQFGFGGVRANPIAWERIVEELKSCVLLCSNCHKEVEAGVAHVDEKQYFIEEYADPSYFKRTDTMMSKYAHFGKKVYKPKQCITCGVEFIPTGSRQKKCSEVCK